MKTKTLWTLAQVSLLALSLGGIAQAADVKSIAVLTPEDPTDFGWNQQGHDAAKAVAQTGAAIGREFSYKLLAAAAGIESGSLERGLAQLIDASRDEEPVDHGTPHRRVLLRLVDLPELFASAHHAELLDGLAAEFRRGLFRGDLVDLRLVAREHQRLEHRLARLHALARRVDVHQRLLAFGATEETEVADRGRKQFATLIFYSYRHKAGSSIHNPNTLNSSWQPVDVHLRLMRMSLDGAKREHCGT